MELSFFCAYVLFPAIIPSHLTLSTSCPLPFLPASSKKTSLHFSVLLWSVVLSRTQCPQHDLSNPGPRELPVFRLVFLQPTTALSFPGARSHRWYSSHLLSLKTTDLFTSLFPGYHYSVFLGLNLSHFLDFYLFFLITLLILFITLVHHFLASFGYSSLWVYATTTTLLLGKNIYIDMKLCVMLGSPWTSVFWISG